MSAVLRAVFTPRRGHHPCLPEDTRMGAPSLKGADIGKHVCYLLSALYWISTTFMLQGVSVRVSGIDWEPISVVVGPAHTGVAAFVWS